MTDKDKEQIANNYLNWFASNYSTLKRKYNTYCILNNYDFDEDIFSDTYLKIYETIRRNGLKDATPQGFDNYTFLSFRTNIKREGQYARNTKRDRNIPNDDINTLYEEWYDSNKISPRTKLLNDLYIDFSVLYIMLMVEKNFDNEHFYLFKLKTLCKMTYKQVQEKSNIKGCRQKIITVQNWLKENVSKEDVRKAFEDWFGEMSYE